MLAQPYIEVARYATVMRFLVSFADEDVNVVEWVHQKARSEKKAGVPSRSLLERERKFKMARLCFAPAWQPSLFALGSKSEGWRQGDSNP